MDERTLERAWQRASLAARCLRGASDDLAIAAPERHKIRAEIAETTDRAQALADRVAAEEIVGVLPLGQISCSSPAAPHEPATAKAPR